MLFGMRYDKHWRHPKHEFDLPTTNKHNSVKLYGNQRVAPIENNVRNQNKDVPTPISLTTTLNEVRRKSCRIITDMRSYSKALLWGSQI